MENIIKSVYSHTINNSMESKIKYLEGEINECRQFIKLLQDEMVTKQDQNETEFLQEQIRSLQEEIIKNINTIESIKNGSIEFNVSIEF